MTGAAETPLAPQDRAAFRRWAWARIRPAVAVALVVVGAVIVAVTWWQVSGQAVVAKQLPYVVSGGITGLALLLGGAFLLATEDVRRELARLDELERRFGELFALLTEELPAAPAPAGGSDRVVALPSGATYHRADCALVAGKGDATEVRSADVTGRGLGPCPVCDPPTPA